MWISWLYNLQKVHYFMKNTTHLLFWEIMGFIHRSFYQDISFQLQCISTRQVCSSVFMWTILEYGFSSFLICFKALPIKILQRGFLIRKHFNSTCIPGANSTFFRTFFNTYILCRLIHYYHFFHNLPMRKPNTTF